MKWLRLYLVIALIPVSISLYACSNTRITRGGNSDSKYGNYVEYKDLKCGEAQNYKIETYDSLIVDTMNKLNSEEYNTLGDINTGNNTVLGQIKDILGNDKETSNLEVKHKCSQHTKILWVTDANNVEVKLKATSSGFTGTQIVESLTLSIPKDLEVGEYHKYLGKFIREDIINNLDSYSNSYIDVEYESDKRIIDSTLEITDDTYVLDMSSYFTI